MINVSIFSLPVVRRTVIPHIQITVLQKPQDSKTVFAPMPSLYQQNEFSSHHAVFKQLLTKILMHHMWALFLNYHFQCFVFCMCMCAVFSCLLMPIHVPLWPVGLFYINILNYMLVLFYNCVICSCATSDIVQKYTYLDKSISF